MDGSNDGVFGNNGPPRVSSLTVKEIQEAASAGTLGASRAPLLHMGRPRAKAPFIPVRLMLHVVLPLLPISLLFSPVLPQHGLRYVALPETLCLKQS